MKNALRTVGSILGTFLIFFILIGGIVTIAFVVGFEQVSLPENDVRIFAPIVFVCVIILTLVCMTIDLVRRKITVDRPAKKIQNVLKQLSKGDFSARITDSFIMDANNRFSSIAAGINLLAEELAGVETLRTDFVANVSHELKTPLAVMQNYGTLLQQPGLSEEKRIEYAKAISDSSRRLASLITNILKLNKLENQQLYPMTCEYDLSEQVCECLLLFENSWERKELNIETDIEDGITIKSDAELLSHVWNNLFSNAIKFTDNGGTVSVSLKDIDGYAVLTVSDTGCGMSSEVGAHIFDKFYQGDTSHSSQGNGLGLALVKRVVDIMQGEISVESILGKGSTFTVKFRRF